MLEPFTTVLSHRGSFDVSILCSIVVGEVPLPEVGIVLAFWVQLVSPGVKPYMQEIKAKKCSLKIRAQG